MPAPVTAWTIARGILLALAIIVAAGWLWQSVLAPGDGGPSACESQNAWWAENDIDRRIDC